MFLRRAIALGLLSFITLFVYVLNAPAVVSFFIGVGATLFIFINDIIIKDDISWEDNNA